MPHSTESKIRLSMRESLGVCIIKGKLGLGTYKQVAEWLDCYEYIVPAARRLYPPLVKFLTDTELDNSRQVYLIWISCDTLYSCLTLNEQERILKWIQE